MMQSQYSLPVWEYSPLEQRWNNKIFTEQPDGPETNEFRVLTYNVWFSSMHQGKRFDGLCDILNKSQADIIGLQEVTQPILSNLLFQRFIQDRYFLSDIDCRTFKTWYGVIFLISKRFRIEKLAFVDFPQSLMGRCLILADIRLNSTQTLRIGTVHLESMNNRLSRSEQLKICRKIFETRPDTINILMGDFNFGDEDDEDSMHFRNLPAWIDVWKVLHQNNDYRYTFDTQLNLMNKSVKNHSDRSRCDRIIGQSQKLIPKQIDIIGMDVIGHDKALPIVVSDHFGLTALFQVAQ